MIKSADDDIEERGTEHVHQGLSISTDTVKGKGLSDDDDVSDKNRIDTGKGKGLSDDDDVSDKNRIEPIQDGPLLGYTILLLLKIHH